MAAELAAGPTSPPVDTRFRPAATGDVLGNVEGDIQLPGGRRTMGRRAARTIVAALLLAACTAAVKIGWQSYGDAAEAAIARWTPQRVFAALLPPDKPALAAQPSAPAVSASAANPAPSQSASPAQTTPGAAAPSVDSALSLGAVAIDIASVRRQVDDLKASIEELKASQQQISRDTARPSEARPSEAKASQLKASEPNLRPKLAAHPRPAAAAPARRPMPPYPPQQAAVYPPLPPPTAPYVPRQSEPPPPTAGTLADPELASVPRPPMPLR